MLTVTMRRCGGGKYLGFDQLHLFKNNQPNKQNPQQIKPKNKTKVYGSFKDIEKNLDILFSIIIWCFINACAYCRVKLFNKSMLQAKSYFIKKSSMHYIRH